MDNVMNDIVENNKEAELCIVKKKTWDTLSKELKTQLVTKKNWHLVVIKFSLKHQLRWRDNLVCTIVADEKAYYEELVKKSSRFFLLYPYHLADVLIRGLRLTPFRYYLEMMKIVMETDKSYDILPNFTAADAYRLLGVGRNQYINIMNESKVKPKYPWQRKPSFEDLLPSYAVDIKLQHWWVVQVGYVSSEDIKFCTKLEQEAIDNLIDNGAMLAGKIDKSTIQTMFKKGLIYLDIPIEDDDKVVVLPLEGFVMNRVIGDYFEKLLYKVFVSSDERTTIGQLATVLEMDVELIKRAMSMLIRLGFAEKKQTPPLKAPENQDAEVIEWHSSWFDSENTSGNIFLSEDMESEDSVSNNKKKAGKRIAILFDSSLTAFLMMGNLTAGLKKYAVVLFEVGKLTEEQMDDFLSELDKVENFGEGEAVRYFEHAITLRDTLRFFRKAKGEYIFEGWDGGINLLRVESVLHLDKKTMNRVLSENYCLLISMAQMQCHLQCSLPPHFGPPLKEMNSAWFKMFLYANLECGPSCIIYPVGTRVEVLPEELKSYKHLKIFNWNGDESIVATSNALLLINHYLSTQPVLVIGCVKNAPVKYVALPIKPYKLDIQPLIVFDTSIEKEDIEQQLKQHPLIRLLNDNVFPLRSMCGFVEFMDIGTTEPNWIIFNLHFGIPFFDGKLNSDLLFQMKYTGILSTKMIAANSKESRKLCLAVLDFISCFSGEKTGSDETIPFPETTIVFHNGKIHTIAD